MTMTDKKDKKCFTGLTEAVVIVTRTTGIDPRADRVIEVAAMKVDFTQLEYNEELEIRYFQARVNPERPIPRKTESAGGISDRDVRKEPPFATIGGDFRAFIGDLPIIAHNATFHKEIVNAELKRAGQKGLLTNPVYCTRECIRNYLAAVHAENTDPRLGRVLYWFSIIGKSGKLKGAMEEAYLTVKLAVAINAIDALPGSAKDRWEYYFENFPTPDQATGKKDPRPWTRSDSWMADFGSNVMLTLTRTAQFFFLFLAGFLLVAVLLRFMG